MAYALGYKSRGRMMRDLTHTEYREACEVMARRPFGQLRDNIHFAMLIRNIVSIHGGTPPDITRLVLDWGTPSETSGEEVHSYVAAAKPITLGS